jgi:excisionase family DNA binding protein
MANISATFGNVLKSGTMPQLPKWEAWTIDEASQATGYNAEYIRRLVRDGKVEAAKVGRVWLVNAKSLRSYLEEIGGMDDNRYGPKK